MFGELQLIPQHVLNDPKERQALAEALEVTFENSLLYPKSADSSEGDATQIPELKFDKLLDSLSRLVPRFQFDLPPYFINNARALSTLEGIAKSLDPTFNVLTIMYPYALNLLIRNPSGSPVVASALQSLIRSRNGRIDRVKIRQLLRDSALISKRRVSLVLRDILKTREGRRLARQVLGEELQFALRGIGSSRAGRERKQKRTGKRWFYLEL
jgi:aarF domain-containing kinase